MSSYIRCGDTVNVLIDTNPDGSGWIRNCIVKHHPQSAGESWVFHEVSCGLLWEIQQPIAITKKYRDDP